MRVETTFVGAAAFAVALAASACSDESSEAAEATDALTVGRLEIARSAAIPLGEVSGLGVRTRGGAREYLAVGDREAALVTFDVSDGGKVRGVARHDLSPLFPRGAPQWEAVAGDGAGRVFVLAEAAGTLSVLSPDLSRVEHTITLVVGAPGDAPELVDLARAWETDENSRGEGVVLLDNGHVLVAKEKSPAAIVELAPPGEAAAGYRPGMAVGADRAFPLPRGERSELVAVHRWLLDREGEAIAEDVSELAVDAEGRLLALTDQGRALLRLEKDFAPRSQRVDVKAAYRLPRRIEKPEGLVVAGEHVVVASDVSRAGDESLFTLTPPR